MKIFISYRWSDSDAIAGRIRDRLAGHYGDDTVFMDVDSIPFGKDFRQHIQEALAQCDVLIAIVGPQWRGADEGGYCRINDETDPVRIEVETALQKGIPILPLLIGNSRMPSPLQLPDSLKQFPFINAAPIDTGRDFHQHMERLLRTLNETIGGINTSAPTGAAKSVAASVKRKPVGEAAVPSPQTERRQLTIMFCQMVVAATSPRRLDPEEQHEILDGFRTTAKIHIERLGGMVAQYPDDGVVAYFGYPAAHEDDAERAVRAGLAMLDAVGSLTPAFNLTLQVRIGVASGVVVVGDVARVGSASEPAAIGGPATLATRLQLLADPGTIVISPETHRLVGALFEYRDLGEKSLRGFAEPIHVRQVLGASNIVSRYEALRSSHGPLVGRQLELEQLRATLDACKATGRGRAVYIRGEAGIGKTRLLHELLVRARQKGFACHIGFVFEFGNGTGRNAIRALARDMLGLDPNSGPEIVRAVADEAVGSSLVSAEDAMFLNDLLDTPQSEELRSIYNAMDNNARDIGNRRTMTRLVEAASCMQPRVLTVEDLHWADRLTLAHLAALAATVVNCPTVLVITSRPDNDPLDRTWRAQAGATPVITVDVGPLHVDEATLLASSFLGANAELISSCVERATGNPLFLEQLLRNAAEGAGSAVPTSVQSIVQARLDRLGSEDTMALQAASVLGQHFDASALGYLLKGLRYAPERLLERLMVHTHGQEFQFSHALIREAIYDSVLKSRRRELHCRAAEWFAGRDAALRAEHLDRAEDPSAAHAYLEAARSEAAKYRYDVSRSLIERGLAVVTDQADRFALACFHGEIMHDLGDMSGALQAFETALEAATSDAERCRAWIGRAQVKRVTDDIDGALADLTEAEHVAVRDCLKVEEARLRFLRGNLLFPRGDMEGCLREHSRSLELAREGAAPEHEAAALGGLGDAEYLRGRMISAEKRLRDCVELSRRQGFGRIEVANNAQLPHALVYFRPLQEALSHARAGEQAAARVGHLRAQVNASAVAVKALPMLGDWDECGRAVAHNRDLAGRLGALRWEQVCFWATGAMLHAQGRNSDAVEILRRGADMAKRTGVRFFGPVILGALAVALREPDERRSALAESEALIAKGCVGHSQLHFYPAAIDVSLELSDWSEAERYASALEIFASSEPMPWSEFFVRRGRVLATIGRGNREADTVTELGNLLEQGTGLGYATALSAIREALAGISGAADS